MIRSYRMSQIMTAPPITVSPDERPHRAQALMEKHRIRHLPVIVSNGEVVAILTDRDLSKIRHYRYPESLRVRDLMQEHPFTLPPGASAAEAFRLMADFKVGAILITTGRRTLRGIFTEHDAIRFLNGVSEHKTLRLAA